MATLDISLPESMRPYLDAKVRSGGFESVADYIRNLVLSDIRDHHLTLAALAEGERSGRSTYDPASLLKELETVSVGR